VVSFTCYLFVRRGRQTVALQQSVHLDRGAVARYLHELHEGIAYIRFRPRLLLMGAAWALFIGGMFTQGIISAPLSDRILNAGAVGYGWLNAGWAVGACTTALFAPRMLRGTGHRRAIGVSMAVLGICLVSLPFAGAHLPRSMRVGPMDIAVALLVAVLIYCTMGCCRAFGGVGITTSMMEMVPRHFMGRVQNTFYFAATCLQLGFSMLVGTVAHKRSLAEGFAIVGGLYFLACVSGTWPAKDPTVATASQEAVTAGS
jgi:MFS family permease